MSKLSRRQLLAFFGASAATTALAPTLGYKLFGGSNPNVAHAVEGPLSFTPVRLPHPLPIYQSKDSFLATGNGQGQIVRASSNPALSSYTVLDDVIVPPEYERYVIVSWGDRVFPNSEEYVGYNNDYTTFVPTDRNEAARGGDRILSGYLWINHEYVSYPFSELAPGTPSNLAGLPSSFPEVIGFELPTSVNRELLGEFMYNLGGSVIRISRSSPGGQFRVVRDSKNRRIHGLSGLGINSDRSDGFQSVTSWGSRSYQRGDNNYLIGTGPSATDVFPLSSDGLGNRIIGTGYNCSGGTTPWGTVLSAEENFQASSFFFVGVQEDVLPNGTQTGYEEGTSGAEFGLVGEKYGWMVEVDPADTSFRPRKHTALGRFRHENIAFRIEAGSPLIAYMGDDRRGGHTWKYISDGIVADPSSKSNSQLFESGTLYVAKLNPDGTGEWIPLELDTPTNPIPPSVLASVELAALGSAQRDGRIRLPQRAGVAGATEDGGSFILDLTNESLISDYQGQTLADFYPSLGAILVDSFLAANLVGGTPTARPEDLEVHPITNEVFIAYTDNVPGGDGYPDSRVFQVAKLSSAVNAQQTSGGLYKIVESSADGTGDTFTWENFAPGGEAGAENGAGYAAVDNLLIDDEGNIWGVTDMSTGSHNGITDGAVPELITIDHSETGATSSLVGVFGNNWIFYIPTSGPNAGEVIPFAYGPPRCEVTGPTLVGNTIIFAVQHPGEDTPIGTGDETTRDIEILNLDGSLFNQTRTVPLGSNWPSNLTPPTRGEKGIKPPRPAVIGIRRTGRTGESLI
jgi:secreted PhoX family phosphatase